MIYLYQLISYKAKKYWDSRKDSGINLNLYGINPYIREYMRKHEKHRNVNDRIIKKYFDKKGKRKLKMLSVGCGFGHLERFFWGTCFFSEIHGCDISPDSIQVAKEKTEEIDKYGGITYFVHDINKEGWEEKYDIIIAFNSVHHIERLEFFYENVKKALEPDGIFIQQEYIGRSRFQHSGIKILWVNLLLYFLPQRLKKNNKFQRPSLLYWILRDPSEAVRSDEIIPLTKKYFPKTKVWKLMGTIMQWLYQCVKADEFHNNKKRSLKLCRLVFLTEKFLFLLRLLKADNALLVSEASK